MSMLPLVTRLDYSEHLNGPINYDQKISPSIENQKFTKVDGVEKTSNMLLATIKTIWAGVKKFFLREYNEHAVNQRFKGKDVTLNKEAIYSLSYGKSFRGDSRWDPFTSQSVWSSYSASARLQERAQTQGAEIHDRYINLRYDFEVDTIATLLLERYKDANKVFIPIVLPSPTILFGFTLFTRNHFAVLCIDRSAETVELYDSKGIDPEERVYKGDDVDPKIEGRSLLERLESIKVACSFKGHGSILYTKSAQQQDRHNCGPHACHFLKDRIEGKSFDEFLNNPSSTSMEDFREEIIEVLIENSPDEEV